MRRLARLLFWLGLAAVAFATLGPIDWRPETGEPPQIERFAAFLALSVAMTHGYPRHRALGWVALAGLAGLLEVLQNHVPGRHGRLVDFDAKALGVLAGALAGLALGRIGRQAAR